jgi:hypothetical protein
MGDMNTQAALVSALQNVGALGVIEALRAAIVEAYPSSDVSPAALLARSELYRGLLQLGTHAEELDAETI